MGYTYKLADETCVAQPAPWTDMLGWISYANYGGKTTVNVISCNLWSTECKYFNKQ